MALDSQLIDVQDCGLWDHWRPDFELRKLLIHHRPSWINVFNAMWFVSVQQIIRLGWCLVTPENTVLGVL